MQPFVTVRPPFVVLKPRSAGSFANAKAAEDFTEQIVGREGTGDLTERVVREAQLFGEQVEGGIGPRGKDEEIEGYRSGRVRTTGFEVERQRVRVMEELGITDVVASVVVRRDGDVVERRLRFTRSWRLGAGWVLVSSHASVVRVARPPG